MVFDEELDFEFDDEEEDEPFTEEDEKKMKADLSKGASKEKLYYWYYRKFGAGPAFEVLDFAITAGFALYTRDGAFVSEEPQDEGKVLKLMEKGLREGKELLVTELGLEKAELDDGVLY